MNILLLTNYGIKIKKTYISCFFILCDYDLNHYVVSCNNHQFFLSGIIEKLNQR